MKIYHTETQADYDALMVELEAEGKNWWTRKKATENDIWNRFKSLTCVFVGKNINGFCYKEFYKEIAPDAPIIKYKAKADTSVKFTKENVEGLVNKYFDDNVGECPGNLIAEIYAMDDTPEKVVVPKFVADVFSSELHFEYEIQESRDIPHVLSAAFSEVSSNKNIKFLQWVKQYPDKYVMAVKYGCEVEKEPLYYIPLPELETSDGIQQVLSKPENGANYFACRPIEGLQQRYTKEELERVPEVYKFYAKLIEEEE